MTEKCINCVENCSKCSLTGIEYTSDTYYTVIHPPCAYSNDEGSQSKCPDYETLQDKFERDCKYASWEDEWEPEHSGFNCALKTDKNKSPRCDLNRKQEKKCQTYESGATYKLTTGNIESEYPRIHGCSSKECPSWMKSSYG